MMQRIYDMSPGNMYKQKLKSKKDVNMHIQPGKVNISRFNKKWANTGRDYCVFFFALNNGALLSIFTDQPKSLVPQ